MCALNECRFPTFDLMACIPDDSDDEFAKQVANDIIDEDREYKEYLEQCNADDNLQLYKDMAWESDHLTPMY